MSTKKSKRPASEASVPDDGDIAAMEAAMRETDAILAADPSRSFADPTLPVFQCAGRMMLEDERARFEAGDKNALLGAVRTCAQHGLVMPDWLASAFIRGYDQVLNLRTGSWDDAFGKPIPKGAHLAALRKKRAKTPAVWLAIQDAKRQGCAIDMKLFDEIGARLGLGKTLVAEYFYGTKKKLPQKT